MSEEIEREMSDTPETDESIRDQWANGFAAKNLKPIMEKLERERDEARQVAASWRNRAFETQCEAEKCPLPWEEAGDE